MKNNKKKEAELMLDELFRYFTIWEKQCREKGIDSYGGISLACFKLGSTDFLDSRWSAKLISIEQFHAIFDEPLIHAIDEERRIELSEKEES